MKTPKIVSMMFGGDLLQTEGLLLKILEPDMIDVIGELSVLRSTYPANVHPTMQHVKGSGFVGAGSATVSGLLTTDTITATGDTPTCSVNGTLTFPGPDCWDVYVHRSGVLWAYWPGINVGQTTELDASGNGHHLTALATTVITERLDGTGTNYVNEAGYSVTVPNRVPAVLKNVRSDASIDAVMPTVVSQSLTKISDISYRFDLAMSDGDTVSWLLANSTCYIDDAYLSRNLNSLPVSSGTVSGAWTTGTNVAAYGGGWKYSITAGDYIEYTTGDGARVAGLHMVTASNGGLMAVTIDGDSTAAVMIPTAQDVVNSGVFPNTILVANGGTLQPTDRVFEQFTASPVYNKQQILAIGLSPGVHTIRLTVTGYKRLAAGGNRLYTSGFYSDIGTDDVQKTKVFSYTIGETIFESAHEFAADTIIGEANFIIGTVHNNETITALYPQLDGVQQSMTNGQTITGDVSLIRQSTLDFPEIGPIATCNMLYSVTADGLTLAQSQVWTYACNALCYTGMFPTVPELNTGAIGGQFLDYDMSVDDGSNLGRVSSDNAYMWSGGGFVARLKSFTYKLYILQDRAGAYLNKIYTDNNFTYSERVAKNIGDIDTSVTTWQVAQLSNFPPQRDVLAGTSDAEGNVIDNPGPLRNDLIVTAGETYHALTVTAPLGPRFQAIPEWTGGAAVDLSTFTDTAQTRVGDDGMVIYSTEQDEAKIVRIDKIIGNTP